MKPVTPQTPGNTSEEIATLIATLHQTGKRLEQLTGGEVDSVANRDGQTFLLQHAQEQLRLNEVARQAAILYALPASIALLDSQGKILSVNEAWQQFGHANAAQNPGYDIGVNYLAICDKARGDDATEAGQAAAGIRAVLNGKANTFTLEYPCHSPAEQRWFQMSVTPLAGTLKGVVVMHLNITANKLAEDALRESERRFSDLLGNVELVSIMLNREARITYCNDYLLRLTGWQREEVIGKNWWDLFVPPEIKDLGNAFFTSMLDNQPEALHHENDIVTRSGERRLIRWSNTVLRSGGGGVIGTASIGEDITERKRDAQKFKDLLEYAPDAMVIVNHEAEIVLVNAQTIKLFGWRREELLGQKIDLLVPERYRSKHPEYMNNFFRQPRPRPESAELELFGLRKDGTEFPMESSLSPLETDEGTLVMSVIRDITERENAEAALLESRRMLRLVLDTIPVRVFWKDTDSSYLGCNQAFAMDAGLHSPEELIGKNDGEMAWVDQAEAYRADDRLVINGGKSRLNYEEPQTSSDGRTVWLRTSKVPLLDARGNINGILGTYEDITEQKRAENRVKYLNRVYAVMSGINTHIVRVGNRDELFAEACGIAVEAGGFRMSMLCLFDRSTTKIVPVASAGKDEELLAVIKNTLSSNEEAPKTMIAQAIREKRVVVANNSKSDPKVVFGKRVAEFGVHSMAFLPLIVSDEAVGVFALYAGEPGFFDEQEIKLLTELAGDIAFAIDHLDKQARLDYLAYYDLLTGLANRTLFLERVAQYIRSAAISGHKLAVGLIDLERFKNINDSLGRPAGDALLKQVAEWLTLNMGDVNLLARIDADHFAAVLPDIKEEGEVTQFVEKSLQAFLDHPFDLTGDVFRIAAKVGVALFPDDGADADTLFRNAEAALKKTKSSGERYLFHTQKMTDAVAGKLTLENQLRQALDNGEFVLHYQPKVHLASGKVTSAEALIRWNDPRTGLVPPGRFIPILEETGLIYEVGRWALRQAIADYLRWRAKGLPAMRIAVNVSPLQLRNHGFIDEIKQAIGIDAHAAGGLELEITESLIMEDVKHNIASLQAVRDLGVSIAIDDFGTGFSSLAYLAKLPVDTLKIDRSFVIDMTVGPQGLALVSTIISLAHSLKLKVVAEGVETDEQSRLLHLLACDEMQGFLFSKPVPAEIFEAKFMTPFPIADV